MYRPGLHGCGRIRWRGGIAYTWTESGQSFVGPDTYRNVEGESARSLLGDIRSESPLKRSMALALINALNADSVQDMSIDPDNTVMFRKLGIRKGARVAMVGYFPPLAKRIESVGAELEILDQGKKIGDKHRFYQKIDDWAEALILTASSILNNTTESVIKAIGPSVKTAIVGPSTPMAPEAFHHLPVQLLAGSVIEDREAVFRAIRHGAGTPVIGRFCRKIYTHVQ
ncbi:hypothetical protein D3OALGA1CA_251 [Olavius algarvensis associated proteobacterium Delta 3]|nr:hypothetical protein D3OALGA1CA_251 [Olavius algarvensis associated proteobacterium Delta 3]